LHTEKKTWTDKDFLNDPKDFQFAIFADRTGGPRSGLFPKALGKLNELRPEFVITVGDLNLGGVGYRNVEKLKGQWQSFILQCKMKKIPGAGRFFCLLTKKDYFILVYQEYIKKAYTYISNRLFYI
jgi:hypothetical protein